MIAIDLNADVAEGTGIEPLLAPLCTSWNVCCGFHAGSADDVRAALKLAREHHIQVGAHPGHPDRATFGRIAHPINTEQLIALLTAQVAAVAAIAQEMHTTLCHLKLHGALYHQAASDLRLAEATVSFAKSKRLLVFGLPGSLLEQACQGVVPFIGEGFADRALGPEGKLLPRDQPGAVIHDPAMAVRQALELAGSGKCRTLCVHGDSPGAAQLLAQVRTGLIGGGFHLRAPGHD